MNELRLLFKKYYTSNVKESLRNFYELIFDSRAVGSPVAIQGIQRSGTNYLTSLLGMSGYKVLNHVDPRRDHPCHKHFRWQPEKNTIAMDLRYKNTLCVSSIHQINEICDYDPDTKHLVIYREPDKWLKSIFNWGLANGWFRDYSDFMKSNLCDKYLAEWDAYYTFWQKQSSVHSDLVLIINYEELINDAVQVMERVDNFAGHSSPLDLTNIRIDKVRHSKSISKSRDRPDDLDFNYVVDRDFQFNWK